MSNKGEQREKKEKLKKELKQKKQQMQYDFQSGKVKSVALKIVLPLLGILWFFLIFAYNLIFDIIILLPINVYHIGHTWFV